MRGAVSSPRPLLSSHLGNHKYIKLQDVKLHYVESGSENENVILLLHGFPDCWFSWRYQIPILSKHFRVIALDMKGFNDSDKPILRHKYRPDIICSELKLFLDALDIKSISLLGHDLGGLVGWFFSLLHPEYVKRCVFIASPHPNLYWNLTNNALTTKNWCNKIQMPFLPEKELTYHHESFLEKFHSATQKNKNPKEDLISTYKYVFNNIEDWRGSLNYFRNFIFYRANENVTLRGPSIFIIGNQDSNYNLETIVKSGEYCENCVIKIVEGAGHFPHQSHSNEVNRILSKFLCAELKILSNESSTLPEKGIVGRMIQKMYGVSQHYYGNGLSEMTSLINYSS